MHKIYPRLVALIVITLLSADLVSNKVFAAPTEEEVSAQTHDLAANFMSPFCPGKLLNDCPSSSATELKRKIAERLAAGESREAVEESLYILYGEDMRASPRARGFGNVAWLTPFIFLGVGVVVFLVWLYKRRVKLTSPKASGGINSPTEIDPALRRKIDSALRSD